MGIIPYLDSDSTRSSNLYGLDTSPTGENLEPELKLKPDTAPFVEKQPISAIRAEVCRVANELRKSAGMSKSMAMRESWAMAKSGRAAFPVSGASIGAATKG
jgi:hypothetical protein